MIRNAFIHTYIIAYFCTRRGLSDVRFGPQMSGRAVVFSFSPFSERVRKNCESEWELPKRNGLVVKRNNICGNITSWSLLVDMESFIRLFARIGRKYDPL